MMMAPIAESCYITKIKRVEDSLILYSERGILRVMPKTSNCVRLTYTEKEEFDQDGKPGIVNQSTFGDWSMEETDEMIKMISGNVILLIDRKSSAITYQDRTGSLLLKERGRDCRELEKFQTYKIAEGAEVKIEKIKTPDGEKEVVREAARIPDEELYHTRLHLCWQENEALYGLGQQEEGFGNLRGKAVYLYQANRKIAIPMLVSSLGYGILVDTYSPMIFRDDVYDSGFYTQADRELDYYFINGGGMDGVVKEYRLLTGKATMLPGWAFGYIQSQERFETKDEILNVSGEYRRRKLGLDCIVLDWMSWPDGLWGQKSFDPVRFKDPKEMTDKLHEMDVHFMISIWPNMDEKCPDHQEFQKAGLLLPMSNVYNAFSDEGRALYWKQVEENLFAYGVDSWWCDSSEPYTPEWNHLIRPDVATQFHEFIKDASDHMPARLCNAYGFFHAKTLYEGQRGAMEKELYVKGNSAKQDPVKENSVKENFVKEDPVKENLVEEKLSMKEKRVVNLTRSAYTGQQRFGTILWSGDIEASWDTYRRQIAAGLHFSMSGLPYWTVDVGAFFVKDSVQWFWKGDYPDTFKDPDYRILYTRWFQWACFLPVFRGHGTDVRRELWTFGDKGDPVYEALAATNRLRYHFMPYIYTLAGKVWLEDESMMRHLAMGYPEDEKVRVIFDEYLFGENLLVCPIVEENATSRKVYLPKGNAWYNYWTKEKCEGGQQITVEAPLNQIPLFVQEGSILPISKEYEHACHAVDGLEIYGGSAAKGYWYDDDGDGYGYEKGDYGLYEISVLSDGCIKVQLLKGDRASKEEELKKVPVTRYL